MPRRKIAAKSPKGRIAVPRPERKLSEKPLQLSDETGPLNDEDADRMIETVEETDEDD